VIHASPGDVFVFFSDGILDASTAKEEQFGRVRLEQVIDKNWRGNAEQIVNAIFETADKFAEGTPVFDDQTVVVMKVK